MTIRERLKKCRRLYYTYREIKELRNRRRWEWQCAVEKFKEEKPEKGSLEDYRKALLRHGVSYDEYMYCYEFWNKDEKKRNEYISLIESTAIYRKTVQVSVAQNSRNKKRGLQTFDKFVSRKWLYPKEVTYEMFKDFVNTIDCIAKPQQGSLGVGIFMVEKGDEEKMKELYAFCCENDIIIEELLKGNEEIQGFHPQSLNTMRVFTVSKGGRCELVASELRIGMGNSVVDNVSAGGIFAPIDLASGTIIRDGCDTAGNQYKVHPDTGKAFKGFVIPHWDKVVAACKTMTTIVPEMVFAGWDVCVLQNGEVELIELNSYPSMTGLQTAYRCGLKPRLSSIGKEILGYDPVKLISVWSKSYVEYEGIYGKLDG